MTQHKRWYLLLMVLAIIGMLDAGYLTIEHFRGTIPPCTIHWWLADCGRVLRSPYATPLGIPLALIGLIHYSVLTLTLSLLFLFQSRRAAVVALLLTSVGLISSIYFVYLQLFVIGAICLFCMGSALTSLALFGSAMVILPDAKKMLCIKACAIGYRYFLKPIFFCIPPQIIHERMVHAGQTMGRIPLARTILSSTFAYRDPSLSQTLDSLNFATPIGLAAGFDYEARLTQILPSVGFGLATVGTITNHAYKGNPAPMLGRLPNSRSLMVNKGFKNLGAKATIAAVSSLHFSVPIGVSIGQTNTKKITTHIQAITDIITAFSHFEISPVAHSYYELNISCPNLNTNVSFYQPKQLHALLTEIDKLHLQKPLFIKMPIEKTNHEITELLAVLVKHSVSGVIFGNLQKNRTHPSFDQNEVRKFPIGNFSGKPTFERSNELIALTYKDYHDRLIIIGCGGVFSPEDAYTKITLGASLVQLITGMIFQGPQLIGDINLHLVDFLKRDGFTTISQAVGSKNDVY